MDGSRVDAAFGFVAGDVALDFVNTVHWRLDPDRALDALEDYGRFVTWAGIAGIVSEKEAVLLAGLADASPNAAGAALGDVVELRESLAEVLSGRADASGELASAYQRAARHGTLRQTDAGWAWTDAEFDLRTPLDRLARAAVGMLTTSSVSTIGQCRDVACGWFFLDTSPRRNRRWCSATGCGDRNRARNYYRRHQPASN